MVTTRAGHAMKISGAELDKSVDLVPQTNVTEYTPSDTDQTIPVPTAVKAIARATSSNSLSNSSSNSSSE
jgi:hypothetical protein